MVAGRTTFNAPWSWELKASSLIGLLAVGVPIISLVVRGGFVVATLLSGVILTLMCRAVRGYEVTPGVLLVRRLLWTTRVPLPKPVVTRVQPRAMAGSWRLWGNGGFFAFSGHFSNAVLGRYRAFVTDMARTVVLTTAQGAIVVSPDDPHEFVRAVTVATDAVS